MIKIALIVGAGGFLGSSGRYLIQQLFVRLIPTINTSGTFVANILGCFLIGIFMSQASKFDKEWLIFFTTGFCGGFTTFSAFCFENVQYAVEGQVLSAMMYIIASILIGLLFTYGGLFLGKSIIF